MTRVRKLIYLFYLFSLSAILANCSTAHINIHTNPTGVEVYLKPIGDREFTLVGQTPLKFTNEDLAKYGAKDGAVQIELRKDGYKPDSIIVTEISKVDININRDMFAKKDLETQVWLNNQVETMFEVTRLVQAKRLDEALNAVRELKKQAPMVATIYELEGGILIMKGQYRAALDAYRLAIKYNPESSESVKMVRHLEDTYGFAREISYTDMDLKKPQKNQKPAQDTHATETPETPAESDREPTGEESSP